MSGIERRLTKLEAASGHTAQMVVVFVGFVPGPDPASPLASEPGLVGTALALGASSVPGWS